MADNAQIEIRLKLEQEVKQRNREQYESIFAGIARIQRDRNLVDFYDEADEIMHELDVPSSAMDLPPDPKIVARYTSMVRRVQGKMATGAQLPGAPGSQQQSNISPLSPAQHAALSAQLGQAGINVNPFGNFNAPMRGGAPGPAGRGRGVGQTGLPADIQRFAQQYQAELAQIGDEVFDRLEKQVLSDQMREAAIDRIRRIRDDASRQALRFPLTSPSRSAVRDIERGASEMQRRLSGQSSQLGFAGAEQVRYDQDVRGPLQDLIRQGVGGGAINRDALADAMRDAEVRRGDIRSNPNIDPSLARRRTEAMAQDMRQASQLARLFPETVQRGTPGRDLASVSPGAVAGFENLQRIRSELQGAREGPMGQLASNRQRELLAELNINQQINRVEQERLRSEGLMTRERQHRFNVLQNEYRLTERDVQGAPVRLTSADISRQAAMVGPQALIGQALQRIAFERGDVGGTGSLAMAGQLIAQRGFGGAAMGGMMGLGSRVATGLTGTSGGLGSLLGGLGALATIPVVGAVAAGAAFTLAQVGPAAQLGMGAANLWRRGGGRDLQGLGNNFRDPTGFMTELLGAGTGLAFDRDEVMAAAQTLAQTGGLRGGGAGLIADRTRSTLRAARFLGVDPNTMAQSMGTMESMNLVGAGPNRMSQERFADLLASSINRGGMRGRETDVLTAITSLTQALAIRGMTTPEMTQNTIGLITAMNASGSPGLRGAPGMQLLGQMDTSVTGARGLQEALLYQAYNRQAGGGMDYLQFIEEQGKGAGSQYFMGAASDIANLGGQDPRRRALALITQYFGGDRSKFGQAMQMDELIRGGDLTPASFARLTGGTMETEGYQPGAGLQGIENLNEAQNQLVRNFQDLASAMLPVIEGFTKLASYFSGEAATVVGRVTNPSPRKQAEAIVPRIPTPGGGTIEGPPIYPDINTPIGPVPNPLHPETESPIPLPSIEPHPTIIPTPWGQITIPDIRVGPGGTPALPAAPVPNLPMPGPPELPSAPTAPSTPMEPGPAEIPSAVGIDQFQTLDQNAFPGGEDLCGPTTISMILQNHLGVPVNPRTLAEEMTAFTGHPWQAGMSWDRVDQFIQRYAERHGSSLEVNADVLGNRGSARIDEVVEGLRQGRPVVFSVDPRTAAGIGTEGGAHLGFNTNHIVGAIGVDANNMVSVIDPNGRARYANGTNRGGSIVRRLPMQEFRNLMRPGGAGSWIVGGYTGPGSVPAPGLPAVAPSTPSAPMDAGPGGADMLPRLSGAGGYDAEGNPRATEEEKARYFQQAMAMARASGLSEEEAAFVVGVGASESNFGNSVSNNFFGLKQWDARAARGEPSVRQRTWEMINGRPQQVMADFAAFSSHRAGMQGFESLLSLANEHWAPIMNDLHAGNITAEEAATRLNNLGPNSFATNRGWAEQHAVPNIQRARNASPPPGSYAPMDQYGQAAASQMNISFQNPTVTLLWPNGEEAASFTLNPSVDVPSTIDRDAYRTMGYYGNG
jgi:hypothetical protein